MNTPSNRKIRVGANLGAKLTTGPFQNENPVFYFEEIVELRLTDQEVLDYQLKRQQEIMAVNRKNLEIEAKKAKILKVKEDLKNIHWYKLPNGDEVPGVTSVLGFDFDFMQEYGITEDHLNQIAAQGTITHKRVEEYIETGEWKEAKDEKKVGNLSPEITILWKGDKKLESNVGNFPVFVEKFGLKNLRNGKQIVNEEHRYGGTYDLICDYEGVATMPDVKRGVAGSIGRDKIFQQIAAYCKCKGMEHIKQMMIIPLNDKTKQGFSVDGKTKKPIVSDKIDAYFELFLAKRKEFKKVYGI